MQRDFDWSLGQINIETKPYKATNDPEPNYYQKKKKKALKNNITKEILNILISFIERKY